MSVLECNRRGCNNIMCDNISYKHGYLCYECKQELIDTNGSVSFYEFMNSEKGSDVQYNCEWEYQVNEEFRSRYEEEDL